MRTNFEKKVAVTHKYSFAFSTDVSRGPQANKAKNFRIRKKVRIL